LGLTSPREHVRLHPVQTPTAHHVGETLGFRAALPGKQAHHLHQLFLGQVLEESQRAYVPRLKQLDEIRVPPIGGDSRAHPRLAHEDTMTMHPDGDRTLAPGVLGEQ
jgi:hypothetical protein